MGSNTITPAPILNRNASDNELLGLPIHTPRRTGQHEAGNEVRDSGAQDTETRANDQLSVNFDDDEIPRATRRGSATDMEAADANATGQLEPGI